MVFFDMDGVLAKFYNDTNCLERMYERDFFRNLKPYKLASWLNEQCARHPDRFGIISACVDSPYCKQEKLDWLKEHIPNLDPANIILVGIGISKKRALQQWINTVLPKEQNRNYYILVDDYSQNLWQWQSTIIAPNNCISIKWCNGRNNKNSNIYHHKCKTIKQLENKLRWFDELR